MKQARCMHLPTIRILSHSFSVSGIIFILIICFHIIANLKMSVLHIGDVKIILK